jgi:hypothetical protein
MGTFLLLKTLQSSWPSPGVKLGEPLVAVYLLRPLRQCFDMVLNRFTSADGSLGQTISLLNMISYILIYRLCLTEASRGNISTLS